MIRLAKVANSDKYPEVTVVLATASSFFLVYSLHGIQSVTYKYRAAMQGV